MSLGKKYNYFGDKKVKIAILGSKALLLLVSITFLVHWFISVRYEAIVVSPVLMAIPGEVSSIVISPIQSRRSNANLVSAPLTINDPADISRICAAMQKAKPFNPVHPSSSWECLLVLNKKQGSYKCLVDSTVSSQNGVLIVFHSNGEWGWSIGEYRSDSLGAELESLVRQSQKKGLAANAI